MKFKNAEINLLLSLLNIDLRKDNLRPSVFDLRESALTNINWNKFIELAKFHEVVPLIFYRLKRYKKQIPPNIYSNLESSYQSNLSRNLKFWGEFLRIYDAFKIKNIPVLPIKGMDLMIRFYPELHLRSMVDIDILIKEEKFDKAKEVLYELDYKKQLQGLKEEYWRKRQCHIEFDKKPFIVEVHWGLDFKRNNRIILPKLWKRTNRAEIENYKINLLSPEDTLFAFALHLRRFGRILSLKQVLDVARIINETSNFDWDYVLKEAKRGKIQATTYFLLIQAKFFTNANIPLFVLRELNITWWQKKIIKRFLINHTFQIFTSMKNNYLKVHFLLYDSFWEPIWYIINIPYEQFCKFYNLKPYREKSNLFYGMRLLYIPIKQTLQLDSRKIY